MKKLLFLVLCHLIISCASVAMEGSSLQKLEEGLYFEQTSDDLYFVFEKVDQDNVGTWQKFKGEQLDARENFMWLFKGYMRFVFKHKKEKNGAALAEYCALAGESAEELDELKKYASHIDSVNLSADPLQKFERCIFYNNSSDVWVAYATRNRPTGRFDLKDIADVEMSMAVLSHKGATFQLHMGIARGLLHLRADKPRHARMAPQFHGFAARAMRAIDPSKIFMISTPLPVMTNMLKNTLPEGTVGIGTDNPSSPITLVGNSAHDKNFEFNLHDSDGNTIASIDRAAAISEYAWFFNNTQPSSAPYVTVDLAALENFIAE